MTNESNSLTQAQAQYASILELLDELAAAQESGDDNRTEAAQEAIHNDPLSVEVRSGWVTKRDDMAPAEFQILLCTGGPAVRIVGELDDNGLPSSAWLEHQDWGTPWQRAFFDGSDVRLCEYAGHFFW